jgi:hypothetical protein
MTLLAVVLASLIAQSPAVPSPTPTPDVWAPIRFMAGEWRGESEGRPGKGTVERNYAFFLNNRFLHETNVSTYPPQEKNPKGEIHHHSSFFSYDRARKAIVLRQFHQEGFVNQFGLRSTESPLVFESEALENVPPSWKARETYEVVSPDEFIETFELANGGTFEVYSRTRFKRVRLSGDER